MADGVTFADGEQVSGMNASTDTTPSSIGTAGGPLDTPTDDKGRTSDVVVANDENMPPMGDNVDFPMDK